ncbi:MAG: hypothetical protein K2W99_02795 [Chthoniobacterales bacterium]|nr:hypothetical protein [Chthoniobacterales bacterium]
MNDLSLANSNSIESLSSLEASSPTTTDRDLRTPSSSSEEGHILSKDGTEEHTFSRVNSDEERALRESITDRHSNFAASKNLGSPTTIDQGSRVSVNEKDFQEREVSTAQVSSATSTPTIPTPQLLNTFTKEQKEALSNGESIVIKTKPEIPKKSTFSKLFSSSSTSQSSIYTAYQLVDPKTVPLQKIEDTVWIPEFNKDTLPFCSNVDDPSSALYANSRTAKYSFEINVTNPISAQITDAVTMQSEKKAVEHGGFQVSFQQEGEAKNIKNLTGSVTAIPYNGATLIAYKLAFDLKGTAAIAAATAKAAGIPVKEPIVERILDNVIEKSTLPPKK